MKIVINEKDLEGDVQASNDCPLFRALKRQGFAVEEVLTDRVTIKDKDYPVNSHYLSILETAQMQEWDLVVVEVEGLKPLKTSIWTRIKQLFK